MEIVCNGDVLIKIIVLLLLFIGGTRESSHEQEQTERERRLQLKKYWPCIIVICVILQARTISADFLQTYQDMLAR